MKFLANLPRAVAISLGVIVAAAVLFGVLFPVLGGKRDDLEAEHARLTNAISQASHGLSQARDDQKYVLENQDLFERVTQSDRLVPHTRRNAIDQLTALATAHGLTTLNYSFEGAGGAGPAKPGANQASGDYDVSAEAIALKVGSSLDTQLFEFVLDLGDSFPGSAVVQSIEMSRAAQLTTEALNQVSRGMDSGLVKGEMKFVWRTAQAKDKSQATAANQAKK